MKRLQSINGRTNHCACSSSFFPCFFVAFTFFICIACVCDSVVHAVKETCSNFIEQLTWERCCLLLILCWQSDWQLDNPRALFLKNYVNFFQFVQKGGAGRSDPAGADGSLTHTEARPCGQKKEEKKGACVPSKNSRPFADHHVCVRA